MFENYLRSLFRNIIRSKFYTALNIAGLAAGLATAFFILIYVQDETGYDKHYLHYNRIYRIEADIAVKGDHNLYATVPFPFGPAMKTEMPEISQMTRIDPFPTTLFRYKENEYYENNFCLADSTVFDVFSNDFIYGNPASSLTEPNSIVLTQKTAEKYFSDKNPVGEILTSGYDETFKVTGVIEDLPGNTHLKFDAIVSMSTYPETYNNSKPSRFWKIGTYTYLLLNEKASIEDVQNKFPEFYNKYMKTLGDQFNLSFTLMTTPLHETHFRQGLGAERPSGNKSYILIFSVVAIFILAIAAINYMNMTTARSANRAKEVGIRKVLGADKSQLIRQFIGESIILSLIALAISFLIVLLLMPDFNNFTGKMLTLSPTDNPFIYFEMIVITLFIGLVSGSYPAFYLSSFQPAAVLKGSVSKSGRKSGRFRRLLVIIQFFIAIFMITGTLVVSAQLHFLRNKDIGFSKENVILMEITDETISPKIDAFKEELLQNTDIVAVSNSTGIPGVMNLIHTMRIEQKTGMDERGILWAQTDYDFAKALQLQFVRGRDFDENMGTDALEAVIINETAADDFGWEGDALGKKIHFGFGQDKTGGRMMKVIGVVKDFHFKSLHNKIEPLIFFLHEKPGYYLICRVNPGTLDGSLHFIEQKWNSFGAKQPFNYKLLTESMDEMYTAEDKIAVLISLTTFITIFIALLGLLGLSSFIAEQKTKEVGLRKVHGATITDILLLLYKDFARLILIAFIVAVPVAWWRLSIWLESTFIYYREPQWYLFLISGIIAFVIGLGTISFYIIRVASKNPVEAIKYE
jgi:putative ABC transport system permease protein